MTEKIVAAWIVLTLVTAVTRIGPLFAIAWLRDQPWMDRIASQLPCMILILLVFHDAEARVTSSDASILSIAIGVAVTLLVHRWKGQTVLSVATGVAAYAMTCLFM
ncbi:hypothetical protein SCG7086_AC_00040 [Chlamydiales bacterium SCGC AG-110-P3]|nr:hypothetical protein SCG7086_AC_00040 [Chlamydiales bacterium SCGC AG-110-P3]